jgi:hypothetical protein
VRILCDVIIVRAIPGLSTFSPTFPYPPLTILLSDEFAQHIASVRHADVAQIQELKNKLREALRRASLQSITGTVKVATRVSASSYTDANRAQQVDGVRDVACVIDSISAPFAARYITQGQFGGQTAARKLLATIKNSDYLDEDGAPCSLSVFVFINAKALYVSAEDALTVHDFIAGFNQADSQTFMVDIGEDQAKMRSRVEGKPISAFVADFRVDDIACSAALVQKGLSSSDTWKVVLGKLLFVSDMRSDSLNVSCRRVCRR